MPRPGALVVKNGSNARGAGLRRPCRSPVSVTASRTYGPGVDRERLALVGAREHDVARLDGQRARRRASRRARSRRGSSAPARAAPRRRARRRGPARAPSRARCPRRSAAAAASRRCATTAFRCTTFGCRTCWRLKASSCRVSAAARSPAFLISSALWCSGSLSGEPPEQDLGVAADGLDEVVEVVRDAAGEPADRLHLLHALQADLALEQALLGRLAIDGPRRGCWRSPAGSARPRA